MCHVKCDIWHVISNKRHVKNLGNLMILVVLLLSSQVEGQFFQCFFPTFIKLFSRGHHFCQSCEVPKANITVPWLNCPSPGFLSSCHSPVPSGLVWISLLISSLLVEATKPPKQGQKGAGAVGKRNEKQGETKQEFFMVRNRQGCP